MSQRREELSQLSMVSLLGLARNRGLHLSSCDKETVVESLIRAETTDSVIARSLVTNMDIAASLQAEREAFANMARLQASFEDDMNPMSWTGSGLESDFSCSCEEDSASDASDDDESEMESVEPQVPSTVPTRTRLGDVDSIVHFLIDWEPSFSEERSIGQLLRTLVEPLFQPRYAGGRPPPRVVIDLTRVLDQMQPQTGADPAIVVARTQLGTAKPLAGEEIRQCTICFDDVAEGQVQRTLPCKHSYHAPCIDRWLRCSTCCPNCKHDMHGVLIEC